MGRVRQAAFASRAYLCTAQPHFPEPDEAQDGVIKKAAVALQLLDGAPGQGIGLCREGKVHVGCTEEVADVVVQVGGLAECRAGGDGVDVDVDDAGQQGAHAGDAAFLGSLAQGGIEGGFAGFDVAAGLQPEAEFVVQGEQGRAAVGVEQPGGAGDVPGGVVAAEAIGGATDEGGNAQRGVAALRVHQGVSLQGLQQVLTLSVIVHITGQ